MAAAAISNAFFMCILRMQTGPYQIRTDDLFVANEARSQLRQWPLSVWDKLSIPQDRQQKHWINRISFSDIMNKEFKVLKTEDRNKK